MRTLPLFILSLIFFFSCTKKSLLGLYSDCTKHCFVYNKLVLKENYEFEYTLFTDVGGERIVNGNWAKINDTLTLNTFEQPIDRIEEVRELTDISDSLKFEFINDGGYIFVTPSEKYPLDVGYKKIVSCGWLPIEKFKVILYRDPYEKGITYFLKNKGSNHFIIKTRQLKTRIFLSDKKYLIKSNRLWPIIDSTGEASQSYYLKKRRTKKDK